MKFIACVSHPCFVESQIIAGDPEGWIFETKVSPLVKESSKLYQESVTAYLDLYCTTVLSTETRDDETMMWHESTTSRYRMHEECPSVAHRCIHSATTEQVA